jgi:hypothetical protein
VFEELYNEYFPKLSNKEAEDVVNYRKQVGKTTDKFTIGEWIGLFKVVNLFSIVENHLKNPAESDFVFFTNEMTTQMKELRNRNTHSEKDLVCYSEQHLALYLESAIICMLQELKMITEGDLVSRRSSVKQSPGNKKTFTTISREDVIRATKDQAINDFKFRDKYVEIEGIKYPAKGLLSIASGFAPSNLAIEDVTTKLEELGFKVFDARTLTKSLLGAAPSISEPAKLPYSTKEEALLHITVTKLYDKLEDLVIETKRQYGKIDGVETLTTETAGQIITDAWKKNHKMLSSFKNDAFRFYLEELIGQQL